MPIQISFDQKPADAISYLEGKGYHPTFHYDEMMHEAHHKAFTVAKIAKVDLLQDIHLSLIDAQKNGTPFAQWKKNIKPALQKKGWWGEVEAVDPKTGEVKTIQIGARRLKTIYYTNMRTSYAVGRYESHMRLPDAVYWRYVAILDGRTRPKHKSMHGVIKHRDDPWWSVNYPPNDWGCRCKVQALTKQELKRHGWENRVVEAPLENIAGKDWSHNVGAGAKHQLDNIYFNRIYDGKKCIDPNAKEKIILCPFEDAKKADYEDFKKRNSPQPLLWFDFVDRALTQNNHESIYLGFLSSIPLLFAWLQARKKPKSDVIYMDTGSVRNLVAKGADSKSKLKKEDKKPTIPLDDIKKLVLNIHMPDACYYDGDILLVWDVADKKQKIVLKLDASNKKYIYNVIKSGQVYDEDGFASKFGEMERIF